MEGKFAFRESTGMSSIICFIVRRAERRTGGLILLSKSISTSVKKGSKHSKQVRAFVPATRF